MRQAFLVLPSLPAVVGVCALSLAQTPAPPPPPPDERVSAELITRADAIKIADAAIASCERQGETAAVFVTDADGHLRAAQSSDGVNVIGLRTATLKTAAVLQFRVSTRSLEDRLKTDPAFAAQYGSDPRYFYHPGAVPVFRNGKFVAVLAVGGAHAKDESCAFEAMKRLPWASMVP
jgi:uncharacterized protein GlcG (DUF336 family)